VLVVVNSYEEAFKVGRGLADGLHRSGEAPGVSVLQPNAEAHKHELTVGLVCLTRSELPQFATGGTRVLVAPAMAIERGYNILDETGQAVFTSLFFLVRPMPVPGNATVRFCQLSGMVDAQVERLAQEAAAAGAPAVRGVTAAARPSVAAAQELGALAGATPPGEDVFGREVRACARRAWYQLEQAANMTPSELVREGYTLLVDDITASLLSLVVQVFGRLARIQDPNRAAPHLYFADSAFAGTTQGEAATGARYHAFKELAHYLQFLLEKSEQPAVARALYGPFYEAFTRGIAYE
jgi:hypothetical protein